ncbi:MAG: hypothetical protein P4M11_13915 [Candidatus Pacebacteria bacterium]|nr:hypothetical protein [Candidatus Paceibacterota bacterium]
MSNGAYIGECSTDATVNQNQGTFYTVFSFNAIIGNLFGIVLLQSEGLRVVLYVVMTIMCINAFIIQLCIIQ